MRSFYVFIVIVVIAAAGCSGTANKSNTQVNDSTVYNMVKQHQILLTNSARLKDRTPMDGASAFLINYKNRVYAVTAKHLIGEGGGISPEIKPTELSGYFISWKMFPRVPVNPTTDTVIISKPALDYSLLKNDILLLPVANTGFNILPLQASFTLPKQGDKLYVIGCPYAEEDCRQNVYELEYNTNEAQTSLLMCTSKNKVEWRGFSGAPVVNSKGEAVGALVGSMDQDSIHYVAATFIKEINPIKEK